MASLEQTCADLEPSARRLMGTISFHRWPRQLARLFLALLAAWLLLSLLAWLSVPPLIRWLAQSRLSAELGRSVQVGRVAFDPWRLAFAIEDLKVGAAPTLQAPVPPPLLTIRHLDLDFSASSLWQRAPVIEAVTVSAARLRITRLAAGRYDVDDLIDRLVPRTAAKPEDRSNLRFAVYNARLHDAELRFDDRPAGRMHSLTALDLALPFLSNLPTQLDVTVAPRLAFRLNGVPFESSALATPFAATRAGTLKIAIRALDVAPYLTYLPSTLPVRIESGVLSTDLEVEVSSPPRGAPTFKIEGTASMQDVRLSDASGDPLASWRKADVAFRRAELFSRRVELASLRVDGADIHVRRAADGTIGLPASNAKAVSVASVEPPGTAASRASAPAWQLELDRVDLTESSLHWNDAAVRPAAALRLSDVSVNAEHLRWPPGEPFTIDARASVGAAKAAPASLGRIELRGSVSPSSAGLRASLVDWPLASLEGYLAETLTSKLEGRASAQAKIDWTAGSGARVVLDSAELEALALGNLGGASTGPTAQPPASVKRVALGNVAIDLPSRRVKVGRLSIDEPSLSLVRGTDGLLDASRWVVASPSTASVDASATARGAPWRVEVAEASLRGGRLQWTDASRPGRGASDPVRLAIADLRVDLQDWTWQGAGSVVPAHFKASGRAGLPLARDEPASRIPGSFDWQGVVGPSPLQVIGRLKTERLPVHLLQPYVGTTLPVRIAHVELGIDGQLSVRELATGLDIDAGADVLLGAVRIETASRASPGEALASWNTLGLKGVQVTVRSGAKPRVDVAEAAMTDFRSRLAVTEDGRLNISTLDGDSPAPARSPASAPPPGGLPVDFRIGATTFANGRVDFSDHFVRPNYSAALTELNGRLGPLDSTRPAMTPLILRGKAASTAQLEIDGSIDPLGDPPALDLRAKASDLELAPLSPYAGKYAGYAIERGKLSMELAYRLGADGKLDATNRVVLNQLTFGDRIESPAATSLPVLLAVALLKDRNGVIDIDLPIRGSVNDPQFSVAVIIGRLLGNLLAKAITSPFSLLTRGAAGGELGGDPARVEFLAGTTELAPAGVAAVDTVARALVGKPGLLLTVTGTADTSHEQEAYRRATLDERIAAERRKASVASAADATAPLPTLSADERQRLVRQIYRETDLPGKPRNALGFASELPASEMETRLKAAIEVDADTVRALALQRGVGVRDALIAKGLPSDRLFLAAPRVDATGATAPEALLTLTPR